MEQAPLRRRIDLGTRRQAGGDLEYLTISLVDQDSHDQLSLLDEATLPPIDAVLGDSGMRVGDFLRAWRRGDRELEAIARHYGRLLYRHLFERPEKVSAAWTVAMHAARGRGLRLEIRLNDPHTAYWHGLPVAAFPFELLCDDAGFLFRRQGWSAVRRPAQHASRPLRYRGEGPPRVQVAWANVARDDGAPLEEAWFRAHDAAVATLAGQRRAEHLPAMPQTTREALSEALEARQPHVLVWVGHGLSDGSGLLLHDPDDPRFPMDAGAVVAAEDFAADVGRGEVDLALLWSCHGAGSMRPLEPGVAEALLDPGLGDAAAVLAAFSTLEAQAAARLSTDLIAALARSVDGDLEASLTRARSGLDVQSLSWARPVLFLRTSPSTGAKLAPASAVPALLAEAGTRGRRLRWLPEQRLQPTAHYVDDQSRLDGLADDLARHPVVVLEGLPGIGKTELALAMADRLRAAGEDVAFVDVTGDRDIGRLLAVLGRLVQETPFETRTALLSALRDRRWTLVLDNAEDLLHDDACREELLVLLRDLQTTGAEFRALVTSRHALAPASRAPALGLFSRELLPLSLSEARRLFIEAAGLRLAPSQATPDMLDPLLEALGRIPRALLLMAGQLGDDVDVAELRRRLVEEGTPAIVAADLYGEAPSPRLDPQLHKLRLASALNLSLAAAVRRVPQSAVLFEVVAAFPVGLVQSWLPQTAHPWLNDALAVLLEHHLVALAGESRRITMSAPVRAHAQPRRARPPGAADPDHADAVTALLVQASLAMAEDAAALSELLGSEQSAPAQVALDLESPNLLAAIDIALDTLARDRSEPPRLLPHLLMALARAAEFGGRASRALPTLQAVATRLHALPASADTLAILRFLIGQLALRTSDLVGAAEAYAAALPLYRQIDSKLGEANTLRALGDLKLRTDDLVGAAEAYAAALPLYRQIDDRLGEANTLRALGDLKLRTADLVGAAEAYAAALLLYRQIDDRLGEANTLQALGDLKLRTDDLVGASEAYAAALPLYRQIDAKLGEANTLKALGDLKLRTSDLVGAAEAYAAALPLYRQIDDRLGEANTLQALGDLKLRTDDLVGAAEAYAAALPLYRQIDAKLGEANTLQALGDLKLRTDDLVGASEAYAAALPLYRLIDANLGEANTLKALGDLKLRTSDLVGAAEAYAAALPLYRQIDDRLGEANTLQALGDLKRRTDDLVGAAEAYAAALPLYRQIDDRLGEANTLKALGDLKLRTDDLVGAAEAYAAALLLYRQIDDRLGEANTLKAMGDLKRRTSDLVGAAEAYAAALPLYRQIDAKLGEANTLRALGDLKLRTDDLVGAAEAYAAALPLYRQIDAKLGEANTLQMLGQLALARGQTETAFAQTLQALRLQQAIANRLGEGAAHGYLASIALQAGALGHAVILSGRAAGLFAAIGDRYGRMLSLHTLGPALLPEAPAQGLACLLQAQSLAREIGDPRTEQIEQWMHALRAGNAENPDFGAALEALRVDAPAVIEAMFAEAEAAVAAGELDPYTLPTSQSRGEEAADADA
jgi:tetratricopeptide (TPR) repeat protein